MKKYTYFLPVLILLFAACDNNTPGPLPLDITYLEWGKTTLSDYVEGDLSRVDAFLDQSEQLIYGEPGTLQDLQQLLQPQVTPQGWLIEDALLTNTPRGELIPFEIVSLNSLTPALLMGDGDYGTIKDLDCIEFKKGACREILKDRVYIHIPQDTFLCDFKAGSKCTGHFIPWDMEQVFEDSNCKKPNNWDALSGVSVMRCGIL